MDHFSDTSAPNRRSFIKTSVAGAAAVTAASSMAHAAGSDVIKVGLIGCGGRGTGAIGQLLNTNSDKEVNGNVQLVAVADAFMDKTEGTLERLQKKYGDAVQVGDNKFAGFDAYTKVIATDCDLIVLATPPGFRPLHLEAAIEAGKHVFMEKPVATDGPGIQKVLAATKMAKEKNLLLQVGLQRRHERQYQETIKRLQDGAIGDIQYMRAFWNGGGVWTRPRTEDQTEMEYQMRNWYYFNWLCGDHIVEQHIHNLDVINWLKDDFPVEAQGMGGRQVRTGKDNGEIYDHHFIEFKYEDGTRMYSQCRHIKNTFGSVSEHAYGAKGFSDINKSQIIGADSRWRYEGPRDQGHQQEQTNLVKALMAGERPNEGHYGAMSTLTSILGRYASYSGKVVTMDGALKTKHSIMPTDFSFDAQPPVTPDENGNYKIPMPGITKPYTA